MRAILLAAGMGTRLRPLTLDTPKSLIEVNKKPLLERQVEFLKEKGIDEIIVLTDKGIEERGNHKELIERGGIYNKLNRYAKVN